MGQEAVVDKMWGIVIPAKHRMNLKQGDRLEAEQGGGALILRKKRNDILKEFESVKLLVEEPMLRRGAR